MPFRHGIHHGISFVVSILLSVLLSEVFRALLPGILVVFDKTSRFLIKVTKIQVDYKIVSILLVALVVAVIYGIVYGIFERRRD